MRRFSVAILLLSLSLLFVRCQREVSYIGGPDTNINPGQVATPDPINAALQGNVFDETGAPAAGVAVQVGSKTALTNANGYFRFNDAALDKKSALVTATKAGYFKAYRTFAATSGANNVQLKLVKKSLTGNIDATTGGEVSLANGSKVALPANALVNAATNAAYSGLVNVYAAYIDPSAADISQTVPGSFMANDKDGKRVTLTSYGMLAVELESASGEKLQIKSGSTSTLTTAIPSATQASAPASIALWSVDESTGIWKEEGTATKSGNVYVGQVKHYSFWNCDVSANAIILSLKLQFPGGESYVNANVRIKRAANNWAVYGRTDSLGQVSGYVPYNEALVMDVLDECGNSIYTQNIGPFTQNTNLGTITVTAPATATVTVKGKLMDCSNAAVTKGFALVSYGVYTRYAAVNATGDFQTTFIRCGSSPATVDVLGVDENSNQQGSAATSVTVTTPITNAGNISACGTTTTQFFTYVLDGTTYNLVAPVDSLMGNTQGQGSTSQFTSLSAFRIANAPAPKITVYFQSTTQTAGTYAAQYVTVNNYDSTSLIAPFNVTLTNFPTLSLGFYEGNISGSFRDPANVTHTLTGTFRIRRR